MKLVKILSALAVIAAAVMTAAGCDSPAGSGNGNEAVFAEADAGGTIAGSAAATKKIKVKFEVLQGGGGICKNAGIVSTQDDSYLVYNQKPASRDFTITITVPASDEYLNVRWWGDDFWLPNTCIKAKMKPESGTITLDYNGFSGGYPKVATKNLYDVSVTTDQKDWKNALKRASND